MPRNWCAARPGRVIGSLTGLLIVMKGLPLAYSKDMQEDKEGTFDALDALVLCIAATAGMVRDLTPDTDPDGGRREFRLCDRDRPRRLAGPPPRHAVPASAHHVTGRIVASGLRASGDARWTGLSLAEMQTIDPAITDEVFGGARGRAVGGQPD